MTKFKVFFACVILSTSVLALAQGPLTTRGPMGSRRTTGGGDPDPGSYTVPATKGPETADPEQQKIWNAAQQLFLNADQRARLESSWKAQREESAALDKALNQARAALAQALQNGQTSLEFEIENLASASAKVQELQLRRWAALYAVLTPEQQRQTLLMPTPLSQAAVPAGVSQAQ
jgi:Spy/CpxP family protein refolding chaperone